MIEARRAWKDPEAESVKMTLTLRPAEMAKLRRVAQAQGRSVTALIREFILGIEEEKKNVPTAG